MYFLIISLSIIAASTLIWWFSYASSIFIIFRKNEKGTKHFLLRVFLVINYAYPFLLSYSLYKGWEVMESGNNSLALIHILIPTAVFALGVILKKVLASV
jgi:hypothetical protein